MQWDQEKTLSSIEDCNHYYAESELNVQVNQLYPGYELLPDGRSLELYLGYKKYHKVKDIIEKSFGLDLNKYRHLRPLFLQGIIDNMIASDHKPSLALDHYLHNHAQSAGLIMGGVETIHEQMDIIPQLAVDDQLSVLLKIARNPAGYRRRIRKMIAKYNAGDGLGLYRLGKKQLGKYRKLMLYDRNLLMAERITSFLGLEKSFVAIGAGHLYGSTGVIHSLRKNDFRVEVTG